MTATSLLHAAPCETFSSPVSKIQCAQNGPATPPPPVPHQQSRSCRSSIDFEGQRPELSCGPKRNICNDFGSFLHGDASSSHSTSQASSNSSSRSDLREQRIQQQFVALALNGASNGFSHEQSEVLHHHQQDCFAPCSSSSSCSSTDLSGTAAEQRPLQQAQQQDDVLKQQLQRQVQQLQQQLIKQQQLCQQQEQQLQLLLQGEQQQQQLDRPPSPTIAAAAAALTTRTSEPLLKENPHRYALSPIEYDDFWRMYKQQLASFWTVDEVDLSNDMRDWRKLTDNEQHFIKYVLAFFAGSDGIVLENLAVRFMQDIQVPEVRAFYGFQIAMENIHSEMYSLLLETYVSDSAERLKLLDAINSVPVIGKKAAWAMKWISSSSGFAQRLLAFACVEGIHFSGSFCAIFWLKKRGLMPGLTFSNELISRDEGLHTDFACLLYSYLVNKLAESEVHQLVGEAVELEREFICEALQCQVVGMNADLMAEYIQYVADRLLVALGYNKLYDAKNPFDWMEMISLQGKANFFERRVGEYQKAGVMTGAAGRPTFEQFVFTTEEDF